ncbi:hypothetical protein HD554DRAFT_2036081 [Boletus coccyginus]|nr:hypothetical protein HD554DRAFT_2036081 [Boletus coccyginus]
MSKNVLQGRWMSEPNRSRAHPSRLEDQAESLTVENALQDALRCVSNRRRIQVFVFEEDGAVLTNMCHSMVSVGRGVAVGRIQVLGLRGPRTETDADDDDMPAHTDFVGPADDHMPTSLACVDFEPVGLEDCGGRVIACFLAWGLRVGGDFCVVGSLKKDVLSSPSTHPLTDVAGAFVPFFSLWAHAHRLHNR